jgi:hypothetical protein
VCSIKRRHYTYIPFACLPIAIIAYWFIVSGTDHKLAVVTFQGFARDNLSGLYHPVFSATNSSKKPVLANVFVNLHRTDRGWMEEKLAYGYHEIAPGNSFLFHMPAQDTNEDSRVIFQFQEFRPGVPGLIDRLKTTLESISNKAAGLRYNGRIYYLTNATNPEVMQEAIAQWPHSKEGEPRSTDSVSLRDERFVLRELERTFHPEHPAVKFQLNKLHKLESSQ